MKAPKRWPKWRQRLFNSGDPDAARFSSKHSRARKPRRGSKRRARLRRKQARYSRRRNRWG